MIRAILAVLVASLAVVAGIPAALAANQDVDAALQQLSSRIEELEAKVYEKRNLVIPGEVQLPPMKRPTGYRRARPVQRQKGAVGNAGGIATGSKTKGDTIPRDLPRRTPEDE